MLYKKIEETNTLVRELLTKKVESPLYRSFASLLQASIAQKRIYDRALIARVCCEVVGGRWHAFLPIFAALELLDCAILIIDDILDEAKFRNDRPAFYRKYGLKCSLILAEIVKSISADILRQAVYAHCQFHRIMRSFERMFQEVYVGQYQDLNYENQDLSFVDRDMYLRMVELTTGAQIAACCEIGALAGGGTEGQIRHLRLVGRYVGTSYQIRDDLIDYIDNRKKIGKTPFLDFMRGKKRLPLIVAWSLARGNQKLSIERLFKNRHHLTGKSKRKLIEIISDELVLQEIHRISSVLEDKALWHLKRLPSSSHRETLEHIAKIGATI